MAIQTATTGQLENAQRVVIEQTRFTEEHSAPCINLVEKMSLSKGEKTITSPKVGQMVAANLTDGVDMTDSEDVGMTTVDLTTSEVGLKVILTDKLVRQENEDMFRIVGRQMGDAMARKKDRDIIALFTALNGGTAFGAASANLTLNNLSACIARAKTLKFPAPVSVIHHPNAIFDVVTSASLVGAQLVSAAAGVQTIPHGFSEDLLQDFYKFMINQVTVFEDGNIDADASDDGIGAIFAKDALAYVEQVGFNTERERDASMRATELVVTADYGVFELDDAHGAPLTYDIANPATNT